MEHRHLVAQYNRRRTEEEEIDNSENQSDEDDEEEEFATQSDNDVSDSALDLVSLLLQLTYKMFTF